MGRVFVAGSINMDVMATAERHPRVGETVAGQSVMYFPGGKGANQAVAAAKLGAPTSLIGRLGRDAFGDQLRTFLADQGVDIALVKVSATAQTGTAIITLAHADNTIVVIPGANAELGADDVAQVALSPGDVAVSQLRSRKRRSLRLSSARVPPARRRSSTLPPRAPSTTGCSRWSTSSCSTRPSLGSLPASR